MDGGENEAIVREECLVLIIENGYGAKPGHSENGRMGKCKSRPV